MTGERAIDRDVFAITGPDREKFLQGLVTNDVSRVSQCLVYAAILTPQGKYLADFFLVGTDQTILLDVHSAISQSVLQRLNMYKLRADVGISRTDMTVLRGLGTPPDGAYADPRHTALGWRLYGTAQGTAPDCDWDAIRVAHCIPETNVELIPNETFILEAGFENLAGVDFKKGCYVGQEVTARMKHKTELRKGLARVTVDGTVPVGTDITANDKKAGTLFTQANGMGIAYLRYDRAAGEMRAGDATVYLT